MPLSNIPVKTCQNLVVRLVTVRKVRRARIITVCGQSIAETVHILLRHAAHQRACIGFAIRGKPPLCNGPGRRNPLRIHEPEQAVLHNRATHSHTIRIAHLAGALPQPRSVHIVAPQLLIIKIGISRSLETVRSGLGHHVNPAAREIALPHIEGSHHNLRLLHSVY